MRASKIAKRSDQWLTRHSAMEDVRFRFGENWLQFARNLKEPQIHEAVRSLQDLLNVNDLTGKSFLDIGSGSGLFSLAAHRLGADVHSFDYDLQSVESTKILRDKYRSVSAKWVVERGSVLSPEYLNQLGSFDVVYSWGVLHHTGAMINALQLAAGLVKSGGIFAFALYRKTPLCWAWKVEKQYYARASSKMQSRIARAYVRLMQLRFRLSGMDFANYVQSYSQQWRGMDFERDVHHWLGGYPYESIRPREVNALMSQLGFELRFSRIEPFSLGLFSAGCDEYVYSCG